jgi:predicted NAD/FAD-binding protein
MRMGGVRHFNDSPFPSASRSPARSGRPTVAVVGSGIAGLGAARALRAHADVTLFEAAGRFGGHTATVDVTLEGITHGVDTGFLVCNERTYPRLLAFFADLGVAIAPSEMSFSVQVPQALGGRGLEWSGHNLASVFCQASNLARPRFWRMLRDLLRFNALATQLAQVLDENTPDEPLAQFLRSHRFSDEFRDWYLLPMLGCIWSCPTAQMLQFPVSTLVRFCHNHGLLQVANRPQWFTVPGGARQYVDKVVAQLSDAHLHTPVTGIRRDADGVTLVAGGQTRAFDHLVLATHPDQALAMLSDAGDDERRVLGAIRYQPNRAVLHTDASVLPRRRAAWAAWNYEGAQDDGGQHRVCLHYLINRLQPLPWHQPVIVSLNPLRPIAPATILGDYEFAHPVFDAGAIAAQARLPQLQGQRNTWYCGAWTGYGFHEDGLASGERAAQALLASSRLEQAARAFA